MSETAIFVDTCISLHYPPLKDADWRSMCGGNDVRLIVCIPVLHDLDDFKSDAQLGDRAQRAIKEIKSLVDSNGVVRDGVLFEILHNTYGRGEFPPDLNPENDDDKILLYVTRYALAHPTTTPVVATEDVAMEMKCRSRDIATVCPSGRLENPSDAYIRRLRQLQNENEELKRRLPVLSVKFVFESGEPSSRCRLTIKTLEPAKVLDLSALRVKYPKQYPKKKEFDIFEHFPPPGESPPIFSDKIPDQEYENYNTRIDRFLNLCEAYNRKLIERSEMLARTYLVELGLINSGTAPANNTDIDLHFPDGLKPMTSEELESLEPEPPEPPEPPKTLGERMQSHLLRGIAAPELPDFSGFGRGFADNTSPPEIRETNSYNVRFAVRKIKHGDMVRLDAIFLTFDSTDTRVSFHADFTITADDLPRPQTGRLDFVVDTGA